MFAGARRAAWVTRELTTDVNRNPQLSTAGNQTNGGQTSEGQFGGKSEMGGWLQQLQVISISLEM